jgi:ATP synthase F1 gamma subunit
MKNRKQLEKDLVLTNSLRGLAQAYEEISVTKMQRVRGKVLASREFLEELSKVFSDVKSSYRSEISRLLAHKKKGSISFSTFDKNGKSIAVLLTSNNKLYGDIGKKVFRLFLKTVDERDSDIYIIGKVGREYYEATENKKPYQYVEFPDNENSEKSIDTVIKLLEQYETVDIFYGQFVNVLSQNAIFANLSGNNDLQNGDGAKKEVKFSFEPSLEATLSLFENQIFSSLYKQTLHESELSHVASRLRQMENALVNIETYQHKITQQRRILIKRKESAKRLQRLSGVSLWR